MKMPSTIAAGLVSVVLVSGCGPGQPSSRPSDPLPLTPPPTLQATAPVPTVLPTVPVAHLVDPIGLVFDDAGNLYVSDCWEPTDSYIFRIDPSGKLTAFAGVGDVGLTGDGGPATSAKIHCPLGMAFGADGAMYFADHANNRIRRVDSAGIITTVAGSGPEGVNRGSFSGDGGPAMEATLAEPYGVAVDVAGNLYISDRDNNRIRKVDPAGVITTIAGNGALDAPVDDVLGTSSSVESPLGIVIDIEGNVLFVDANNKRVRKIDAEGIITTLAGTGENAATGDGGPATKAALADPENLVFDRSGNLYVTDTVNNILRVIDRRGIITTQPSHRGGAGLAIDDAGNLYVTDANGNRVYRIEPDGGVILFAGQG